LPRITALDSGAFLIYLSGDVGPVSTLEWMTARGELTQEDTLEGPPAQFAYARHDTAFIVTNEMLVGDTFYVNRLNVWGFAPEGRRILRDTLLTDTLSLRETTMGTAYDLRADGTLMAVMITGHGTASPNFLSVRVIEYTPQRSTRHDPWDPGPAPNGSYLQYPSVAVTPEGGGVLAYNLRLSDASCELCVQGFDAQGQPAHVLRTFFPESGAIVNALDVHVQAGTVYLMYTLISLDHPERGGAYVRGFPLSDIEAADERTVPLPQALTLAAYPNPFNSTTRLEFDVPNATKISLSIYNTLGQEITRLANEQRAAGHHTVLWDAQGLPTGLYYARLATGELSVVKKVMLMR
jgi:hypothetical protein